MEKFTGLLGIALILGIAFLLSNNKKQINLRLVLTGLGLQVLLAVFILKTDTGKDIFGTLGKFITHILEYANRGGDFVFGVLVRQEVLAEHLGGANSFIFMFKLIPTIIFVAVLVNIAYHVGIMQRVISGIAWAVYKLMRVSGSEALSNVASAFVGQVEAQIMIKPYINSMTKSELLASMTGSMACIAGGVMAVYIGMGVQAEYLIAASLMAAPGALVISKIVYPETEVSATQGTIKLEVKKSYTNLLDAISHGASDGLKISLNVIAMLIGFIALIALVDGLLGWIGANLAQMGMSLDFAGINLNKLSMKEILGAVFSIFAWTMGVPAEETLKVGGLLGTKIVINEFMAYNDLTALVKANALSPKAAAIVTFALCGFANLSSIAIQVGGIGELAPQRRADLATLGVRALICGTLASYLSATIAGIMF
jgi:CNT family concentrative nucleoside transporter